MKIVVVDDEELLLYQMKREIEIAIPDCEIYCFDEEDQVLEFLAEKSSIDNPPEYAFLDIKLRGLTGIELSEKIRKLCPKIRFIFCTAFSDYALDAYKRFAIGYLLKPVNAQKITELFESIGVEIKKIVPRVSIHTFGNFDVYKDGKMILFQRKKAKELLAYLIDRKGTSVTSAEACAVLWEDMGSGAELRDRFQHTKKDLRNVLEENGISDILQYGWNSIWVDIRKVDCDYYRFLNGDEQAKESFSGEYMTNYSWAEETAGWLTAEKEK